MQSKQAASFIDWSGNCPYGKQVLLGQWHLISAYLEPIHEAVKQRFWK
jgi:hypothetical protein